MFNREVGNIPKGELGGGGLDKKGVKKTGGGGSDPEKKNSCIGRSNAILWWLAFVIEMESVFFDVCISVYGISAFTSSLTPEIYKMNHQFNCNDKCLIYLITCKQCLKQHSG